MNDPKTNVRCGDCLWEGPVPDLTQADGHHYCPKCGREIMAYSLPLSDSTPTDLEKSLGVEYVDPAYPPGEHLRYGMEWDGKAKEIAERVKAELQKGGSSV
jgi:hypothetical protein